MSARVRAFVAVSVPAVESLLGVREELRRLGRAVRPVACDDWHVTLKFLGDVPTADVAALASALRAAVSPVGCARCTLKGLGVFPAPQRPSVVWAGIPHAEVLSELAARVESACESLGFPRESRAFHPHLTLARIKSRPPAALAAILEEYAGTDFGAWEVTSVVLLESVLERSGAQYVPLATFPLAERPPTS
jgi:2'-5' RNA ligase